MTAERKSCKAKPGNKSCLQEMETIEKFRPLLTETQYRYLSLHARGLSGVEIARMYNVNPSVVSRGISRAKNNLNAAMEAGYVFARASGSAGLIK